jgi:hypothetical protein
MPRAPAAREVTPAAREAKQLYVKEDRSIDVLDVQDRARKPVSHRTSILELKVVDK